eukprot:1083973-Prymnesium_polylepis.1
MSHMHEAFPCEVDVRVTLNLQDYTQDAPPFSYYLTPLLSSVIPAAGPVSGGTLISVSGSLLGASSLWGRDLRCRISQLEVPATL